MPKRAQQPAADRCTALEGAAPAALRTGLPGWTVALLLAVLLLVVYGGSLSGPFIFDDRNSVVENDSIRALWPLIGKEKPGPLNPPVELPTSGRPLVNLSFAINYQLGGLEPFGYRIANVVMHFCSALLVYAIVNRTLLLPLFDGRFESAHTYLAAAIALLWALHPLQTEAVVYVTQRTELMMAFFYLATMCCALRFWAAPENTTSKTAWLLLAVASCVCGMASKEVMVSAPLIVLLFERTFLRDSFVESLRRSWRLYCGLAATWLVLLTLAMGQPHRESAGFAVGVPAYDWWLTQSKVFFLYLKLILFPWPLLIHYEFPYFHSLREAWPFVLALAFVGAGVLYLLWKNRPLGFVGTWMFAILAPTFVIPIATELVAERRMYLALIAPVAVLAVCGYELIRHRKEKGFATANAIEDRRPQKTLIWAAGAIAVAFCFISGTRLGAYGNELGLWTQVLESYPGDSIAHQNVGAELEKMGDDSGALEHYREATRLNPNAGHAHYVLGEFLRKHGSNDGAILHFKEAARIWPKNVAIRNNLGVTQYVAGRNDEAIDTFREAIEIDPNYWMARQNLGIAYRKGGKLDDSIAALQAALQLSPESPDLYIDLARSYRALHQPNKAAEILNLGIEISNAAGNIDAAGRIKTQLQAMSTP